MVGLYLGAGLAGGVVFGALMPLGRTLGGSILLGLLVGLPVSFLLVTVAAPDLVIGSGEFIGACLVIAALGPFCGVGLWNFINRR